MAGAAFLALALAWVNLATPSLWHDELVHVYVAREIVSEGKAQLPSGVPYHSGALFNGVLAAVAAVFGDGEFPMRAPSGVFHAINVVLLYGLARCWAGRGVALCAALFLACSPWAVAWARQARFYTLQQTIYLLFVGALWMAMRPGAGRQSIAAGGVGAAIAYPLGLLASFHSVFFLPALALLAGLLAVAGRWRAAAVAAAALLPLGLLTWLFLRALMNPTDVDATTNHAGVGIHLASLFTRDRWFYAVWLHQNLSTGFLLLAFVGLVALPWRRGLAGWFPVLAFLGPLLALTFLLNYRWDRFLFFAYPALVVLQAAGLLAVLRGVLAYRKSWAHTALAVVLLAFSVRLAISGARLFRDSVDVALGAHTTLAAHHPDWRDACDWIRGQNDGRSILATSYLPVHYQLGRVDDWFPNTWYQWEAQDSGLEGISDIAGLEAFIARHPTGYFIAEHERLWKWRHHGDIREILDPMVRWVEANMDRVYATRSGDVLVYRWPAMATAP